MSDGVGGAGTTLTFGEARVTPVVELTMPTSVRWLLPEHPDATRLRDEAGAWLRPDFMNERGHLLQTMQSFVVEVDGLTVASLRVGDEFVAEDAKGERLVLTDVGQSEEPPSCHLLGLLPKELQAKQTLVCRFRHDLDTRQLRVKPLSIVTDKMIVRLTF